MIQHVQAGVASVGSTALASVGGLPWWAQLVIGVAGVVVSFLASRQSGGGK